MAIVCRKWKVSKEDFEERKNKAIELIKDVEFISTPRVKFRFTEKELREEFWFEDINLIYDKYDNVFFNGDYVLYPKEKLIWV